MRHRLLVLIGAATACARPTWVDDLLDPLPLLSQAKTVWHFARGETSQAIDTSDRFTRRCPGVSQMRSLIELAQGRTASAKATQQDFLNQPSEFVKDFLARESMKEAEMLGNQLVVDLESLIDEAVRRLPAQSKFFFVFSTQTFAAMCTIWTLFQCTSLRGALEVLGKGALALLVILALDVVMSAALDDQLRESYGECCPCR